VLPRYRGFSARIPARLTPDGCGPRQEHSHPFRGSNRGQRCDATILCSSSANRMALVSFLLLTNASPRPPSPRRPMAPLECQGCDQGRQLRTTSRLLIYRHERKADGPGVQCFRRVGTRWSCACLNPWCICQWSVQWQRRIGELEWGISRDTLRRSLANIAAATHVRRPELSLGLEC
jgi:hypothetical protein